MNIFYQLLVATVVFTELILTRRTGEEQFFYKEGEVFL